MKSGTPNCNVMETGMKISMGRVLVIHPSVDRCAKIVSMNTSQELMHAANLVLKKVIAI